ncbi:hypothetical protein J503_3713 [Acinetobacter baumannii 984213]|uniref:hypothetical protein n=1 Tax=Acinetobacter baumannii TaxID=470 RepID=UPI00044C3AC1|nr:hypothetical protein [Acinetobacter baumannii]EKU1551269.1 hypothetical protein [Acinetobacter baumannii]EKU2690947.1 hypothetical protein [Acinetobacter baumannii]EKU5255750.1 hypothetical protein [Acinetobacter baumannii]EKU6962135.1 hypothetical protein [Acinetobacter baumannii]EKU7214359.1 hypothetical protein [Acinetobacter baumannii]
MNIIEPMLYILGILIGSLGLIYAIRSMINTRNEYTKEFLNRHKDALKKHNHLPKE